MRYDPQRIWRNLRYRYMFRRRVFCLACHHSPLSQRGVFWRRWRTVHNDAIIRRGLMRRRSRRIIMYLWRTISKSDLWNEHFQVVHPCQMMTVVREGFAPSGGRRRIAKRWNWKRLKQRLPLLVCLWNKRVQFNTIRTEVLGRLVPDPVQMPSRPGGKSDSMWP